MGARRLNSSTMVGVSSEELLSATKSSHPTELGTVMPSRLASVCFSAAQRLQVAMMTLQSIRWGLQAQDFAVLGTLLSHGRRVWSAGDARQKGHHFSAAARWNCVFRASTPYPTRRITRSSWLNASFSPPVNKLATTDRKVSKAHRHLQTGMYPMRRDD